MTADAAAGSGGCSGRDLGDRASWDVECAGPLVGDMHRGGEGQDEVVQFTNAVRVTTEDGGTGVPVGEQLVTERTPLRGLWEREPGLLERDDESVDDVAAADRSAAFFAPRGAPARAACTTAVCALRCAACLCPVRSTTVL